MEPALEIALARRTVQRSLLTVCGAVIVLGILVVALIQLTNDRPGAALPLIVVFGIGQLIAVLAGVFVLVAGRQLMRELSLVETVRVLERLETRIRNLAFLSPAVVVLAAAAAVLATDRSTEALIGAGAAALIVGQLIWVLLVIRTRVHLRANRILPFAKVE